MTNLTYTTHVLYRDGDTATFSGYEDMADAVTTAYRLRNLPTVKSVRVERVEIKTVLKWEN